MSNDQHDTEAHVDIPKDERAGAQDTESHAYRPGRLDDAEESLDDAEGHAAKAGRLEDAEEALDDTEAHGFQNALKPNRRA